MIGVTIDQAKGMFFDRKAVTNAVDRTERRVLSRSSVVRPFRRSSPQTTVVSERHQWFPSVENLQLVPLTTLPLTPYPLPAAGGSKFENRIRPFLQSSIRPAVCNKTEVTMKKQEELVIITKTYDLILWSCNHTSRFPRQHRFVLGERLERSL